MLSLVVTRSKVRAVIRQRSQSRCLVADFRESVPPLVWQLDLDKNPNVTVALHEKNGGWDLVAATPASEAWTVARFEDEKSADAAYTSVRCALAKREMGRALRLLLSLIGFVLLVWLVAVVYQFIHSPAAPRTAMAGVAQQAQSPSGMRRDGEPMVLDDFLKAPESR